MKTIRITDDVHKLLKVRAAEEGATISECLAQLLGTPLNGTVITRKIYAKDEPVVQPVPSKVASEQCKKHGIDKELCSLMKH